MISSQASGSVLVFENAIGFTRGMFEGFRAREPKTKYPLCLEGARACPPEDCGGPWGYAAYLTVLADPEHEDMLEWQGPFDPEAFDPEKATTEMRKVS